MGDDVVRWRCSTCGHKWKGKSPRTRARRPYCTKCGSRNVRVADWLIDTERWEGVRKDALDRANRRCEVCGRESSPSIHHLSYDDYYDLDQLVCLCKRCHYLIHGRAPSYMCGLLTTILGMIALSLGACCITELRASQLPHPEATYMFANLGIPVGLVLFAFGVWLARETLRVWLAARKAVERRSSTPC